MEEIIKFLNPNNMKAIGFLKNHSPEIKCSIDISELLVEQVNNPEILLKSITYLENGIIVIPFTLWLTDIDGENIGPYIIYTDGYWMWPSYYSFYLKKYPNIYIPNEFIIYIQKNQNSTLKLSVDEKSYAEYLTIDLLKIRMPHNWKPNESLQKLIKERGGYVECLQPYGLMPNSADAT